MLLSEMRSHGVPYSTIGQHFGISPLEVFHVYVRTKATALRHGWKPRMTQQDIQQHLERARSAS